MYKYEIESSIGHWINQSGKQLYRNLFKLFKDNSIQVTPEQWLVMAYLFKKERVSQSELAAILNRDNSSITRIIDTMAKNGLVERINHETDRRIYLIILTAKGQTLQSQLISLAVTNFEMALVGVDEKDLDTTIKVLKKINQNLNQ